MKLTARLLVVILAAAFAQRAALAQSAQAEDGRRPAALAQAAEGVDGPRPTALARAGLFPARGVGLSHDALPFALADTDKPLQEEPSVNVEGKKSPWIAGGMSLLVPGAGEAWTQSYIKAGVFFAAEIASWVFMTSYNKKGDNQDAAFKAYANEHYSVVRYVNWTIDNSDRLNPNPPHSKAEYIQMIYGGTSEADPNACPPPFSCVNWAELNRMEQEISGGVLNGYTHNMPYYGVQQYYELIGKYEQFSRGWDDSDPTDPAESLIPVRSTSRSHMRLYADMRSKANEYYDIANTFVGVIVANHLLSAADAIWSATRYNSSLHASIDMHLVPTSIGLVPFTQATLKLDL